MTPESNLKANGVGSGAMLGWIEVSIEPREESPIVSYFGPYLVTDGRNISIARFDWTAGTYTPRGWHVLGPHFLAARDITHWMRQPALPNTKSSQPGT